MSSSPSHIPLTDERWSAFLNSQSLFLNSPIEGIELFDFPSLSSSQARPIDITLRPQGKQMEQLMAEAIERSDRYDLIVHGLQVPDTGRTIGELDFLIFDKEKEKVIHMEMVYKYFIHDAEEGGEPLGVWIGPGRKDRLTWKLEHLAEHQFPLLHHSLTRPLLDQWSIDPSTVSQQLCFLGELYSPHGGRLQLTESINPKALKGEWMALEKFMTFDSVGILALNQEKPDWLMPFDRSKAMPLSEITVNLIEAVKEGRPVLLSFSDQGVEKKQFVTAT